MEEPSFITCVALSQFQFLEFRQRIKALRVKASLALLNLLCLKFMATSDGAVRLVFACNARTDQSTKEMQIIAIENPTACGSAARPRCYRRAGDAPTQGRTIKNCNLSLSWSSLFIWYCHNIYNLSKLLGESQCGGGGDRAAMAMRCGQETVGG